MNTRLHAVWAAVAAFGAFGARTATAPPAQDVALTEMELINCDVNIRPRSHQPVPQSGIFWGEEDADLFESSLVINVPKDGLLRFGDPRGNGAVPLEEGNNTVTMTFVFKPQVVLARFHVLAPDGSTVLIDNEEWVTTGTYDALVGTYQKPVGTMLRKKGGKALALIAVTNHGLTGYFTLQAY